ncbi:MAG: hypothetical protein ACLR23_24865 [Clostridia bacterium]|jgi:hypothetical protein|uniref:Uncharacterized protein n=1 Tax=Bianquea renquensis TaxID=2763661 RepID=A0A926HW61_9FIRM|nr:hypothetical protein [Bianquea renquensis]MBC8542372.1 hypothetical protein [Bianquea renquensis]
MFNFHEELGRYKPSEELDTSGAELSGEEVKDIVDIVEMILKGEEAEE